MYTSASGQGPSMSAGTIVEELERLGVELRAVDDDLEYEGPEEAITPELLEQLKAHKPELLAVFRDAETVVEEGRQPAQVSSKQTLSDPEARKLLAAGWERKSDVGRSSGSDRTRAPTAHRSWQHISWTGEMKTPDTKAEQTERGNTTRPWLGRDENEAVPTTPGAGR